MMVLILIWFVLWMLCIFVMLIMIEVKMIGVSSIWISLIKRLLSGLSWVLMFGVKWLSRILVMMLMRI